MSDSNDPEGQETTLRDLRLLKLNMEVTVTEKALYLLAGVGVATIVRLSGIA